MGGLLVLVLVGLYLWIAYVVVRKVPKIWGKALALVVAVLIPTADAVYGRLKLKHLCETEGGVKMFRTVEGVEGVRSFLGADEYLLKEGRYRFVEGAEGSSGMVRNTMSSDGSVAKEKNVTAKSLFSLEYEPANSTGWFRKSTYLVKELASGEILGSDTNIVFMGGWIERFIGGLYGGSSGVRECASDASVVRARKLVYSTLKSIK